MDDLHRGWPSQPTELEPRRMHLTEFAGLFAIGFLAATVFPFQSEVVLAGMVLADHYPA